MIVGCGSGSIVRERDRPEPGTEPTHVPAASTPTSVSPAPQSFSLLSTNGGVVNFKDLRGTVPVGVFFYGGADCVGCEERLQQLQANYERFKQVGAELIAISTDLPEVTRATVEKLEIEFPVLTDVDGSVSGRWGVFNKTGTGHAAPSIFLFGPSGDVVATQVSVSANELPAVDEMLQTIQRALESGTAQATATPRAAEPGAADGALLGPGVTDFRMPDAIGGGEVSLSETLRDRNVVLVFYRAFW